MKQILLQNQSQTFLSLTLNPNNKNKQSEQTAKTVIKYVNSFISISSLYFVSILFGP